MNRILLIAGLLIALVFTASADRRRLMMARNATASPCSTSDATIPHDTFLEGFEGTGYENTWTESGTTAGIDEDYSASWAVTGSCSQVLRVVVPDDGTETYVSLTNGTWTLSVNVDLYFYLLIPSSAAPATGEDYRIAVVNNNVAPGSNQRGRIHISNTGGTLGLYAQGSTISGTNTITTDTTYLVKMHLNTTVANSYLQIDGGTQHTFTRNTGTTMNHIHFGACEGLDAGEGSELRFDLLAFDTP